jgi:hypothetical protein
VPTEIIFSLRALRIAVGTGKAGKIAACPLIFRESIRIFAYFAQKNSNGGKLNQANQGDGARQRTLS